MKKVIVSDYDQTFYINDEDIEKNKIAVKNFMNKGNIFIIATGRSYFDLKNKVNEYNIDYDYCIINHGATVLDKNDNIMFNFPIDNDIIRNIKRDMLLERTLNNFCCSLLESRVEFEHKDLTKINVKYNSKEYALDKENYINNKYGNFVKAYYVNTNSIEIISNKTNKAKAIYWLIKFCNNVNKANTYVIGDGYSDIEMVKKYNGYCVKKSVDELKNVSSKVYDTFKDFVSDIIS